MPHQIGLDATSIAAALLHDVVEDTEYSFDDIEKLFGSDVMKIVEGLTKISKLSKESNVSLQAQKIFETTAHPNDDIRVIIIKIADRLHNMQTLDSIPEYKQIKIASETLYIYAPLSHRIGLYNIKTELERQSLSTPNMTDTYLSKIKLKTAKKNKINTLNLFPR